MKWKTRIKLTERDVCAFQKEEQLLWEERLEYAVMQNEFEETKAEVEVAKGVDTTTSDPKNASECEVDNVQ